MLGCRALENARLTNSRGIGRNRLSQNLKVIFIKRYKPVMNVKPIHKVGRPPKQSGGAVVMILLPV